MGADLEMVCALPELSAGMSGVVGFFEPFDGDVGVNLRGGEVGVTEEFLDAAEIGAAIEEMRGVTVAEFMRSDRGIEAGAGEISFEARLNNASGDGPRG